MDKHPKMGSLMAFFFLSPPKSTINPSDQTHHSTKAIAETPSYMTPEIFLIGSA